MTWSCQIVKASAAEAQYHFDHRGTFLSGGTIAEAKRKVENEIARSGKVQQAHQGKFNVPDGFIREASAGSAREGYWYIREYFMVAPR